MSANLSPVHDAVVESGDEGLREQAMARLHKRREFTDHLTVFVVVNAVIWAVWLVIGLSAGSWWPWPIFPTIGWGLGLILHAWDVYLRRPITEADVDAEVRRLRGMR